MNAFYDVIAIPSANLPSSPAPILTTVCGVRNVADLRISGTVFGRTNGTSIVLSGNRRGGGITPNVAYTIVVISDCFGSGFGPGPYCLPGMAQSQSIALTPAYLKPLPSNSPSNSPSISFSSTATATATAAAAASPSPAAAAGGSSIAGPAIGGVITIIAVGVLGFFGYRWWQSKGGASYSRVNTGSGTGMLAHPIFGAPSKEDTAGGAEYSTLA